MMLALFSSLFKHIICSCTSSLSQRQSPESLLTFIMPHSPLLQTVHAPITNIGDYEDEIRQYRAELDRGENNKYAQSELTDLAETLVERCKFLNSKLIVKVRRCFLHPRTEN